MRPVTCTIILILLLHNESFCCKQISKRALQKSHEKTRIQKLSEAFLGRNFDAMENDVSLINLLIVITKQYLTNCYSVVLYDNYTESNDRLFLKTFLKRYNFTNLHGTIESNNSINEINFLRANEKRCISFIIFVQDAMKIKDLIRKRTEKVIVIAKSSQWRIQEFLFSEYSQQIPNLLIIAKSDKILHEKDEAKYILYTHNVFVDALGSSEPIVLTSWSAGTFSRNVTLFPPKMSHGFSGHRFLIAAAHQPPYVIKKQRNENDEIEFDGIEIKILNLLSKMYNFTTDYKQSSEIATLGSGEAVMKSIKGGIINLGIGGLFVTPERYNAGSIIWHSEDCAAFISLASTALPKYRAIMGPFRWTVWLALILVYLGAIFLFTYSDQLTLKPLLSNPEEIENMFWYVFGTFTNCFVFTGKNSWRNAAKNSTKLLIGVYWIFTIIITACYTGSIIAFVTLPAFPPVVDTMDQLASGRYQIGMLDKGGWPNWFSNVSDKVAKNLLKKVDYVSDIEGGLKNVTKAFFWPYAYLGSREELSFIVKTNFSVGSKRSLLHISKECFVPYKVGIILSKDTIYNDIFLDGMLMIQQTGLNIKIKNDVEWNSLRSSTGKLLAANSKISGLKALSYEDRALTLDDTQGMFLLLGIGFLLGGFFLIMEIFGGCFNLCKKIEFPTIIPSASSIASNPRRHPRQTPRERIDSISIQSSRRESNASNILRTDDTFGEILVHVDINKMIESEGLKDEETSDSDMDYSEEIRRIFSDIVEEENDIFEEIK